MNHADWLFGFLILLFCLGLLVTPTSNHQKSIAEEIKIGQKNIGWLECSEKLDLALNHFEIIQAGKCVFFPYSMHSADSPLSTSLGRDANHYY
jgi:hypothetical protein